MLQKTIGQRIKTIRKEFGLTQKDFGTSLGISREVVNALESDRFEPRMAILVKIKKKFSKDYDWLMEGK